VSTHIPILKSEWVGQQIDTFPLLQWLGSSDAGDIFLTETPGAGRAVLHLRMADSATAQDQLRNWQLAIELDHPHLLRTFACGRTDIEGLDHVYLVTELPEEALSEILPERALTADEAREMLGPILEALGHLHEKNLLHGDLNPETVLVAEGRLKLSTLGIRPAGSLRGFDETLRIYDAPESRSEPLSPAADIWSLGITLVEALTQKAPAWMHSSGRDPLIPVTVPQPLSEIARRCLLVDPAHRCTVVEIQALLTVPVAKPAMPAIPVVNAPAPTPEQIEMFQAAGEFTPGPSEDAGAKPFSRTMRSLDEEDEPHMPPRQYIRAAIASVAALILLIAGWSAYRHKRSNPVTDKASAAPAAGSVAPKPAEPPRAKPHTPPVKGEIVERVMPEIPARASRGIHGKVETKVRVTVDHTGRVINANIDSPGKSRYFAERAAEAARKWRFKPARVDGRPTSSVWQLRFEFRQDGTTVSAAEVTL
jgi:TonB family protein